MCPLYSQEELQKEVVNLKVMEEEANKIISIIQKDPSLETDPNAKEVLLRTLALCKEGTVILEQYPSSKSINRQAQENLARVISELDQFSSSSKKQPAPSMGQTKAQSVPTPKMSMSFNPSADKGTNWKAAYQNAFPQFLIMEFTPNGVDPQN